MECRISDSVLAWVLIVVAAVGGAYGDDWPTYNRDAARSAVTPEQLSHELRETWVVRSPHPPQVAWPGPAKWDGWNKVYDLKDRTNFDAAFPVVVAGDLAYYGSNVDDKVYCLDVATGEQRWVFYTEGPVRLAPTVADGRVYVGSDDGYVYCLDAVTGALQWKHRPGPEERRVIGNGRMISVWPVRTGVVVMDGVAYACAGVFPSETVYLCAMDAATGRRLWKTGMEDLPAQGYLLASSTRLYVTTGRNRPVVFNRENGERIFQVSGGGGGTYALLTGDTLIYGPGKTGEMSLTGEQQRDQLASFPGNHMIVAGPMSYLQTDTKLTALDRAKYIELHVQRRTATTHLNQLSERIRKESARLSQEEVRELRSRMMQLSAQVDALSEQMNACYLWELPTSHAHALILAGRTLYAGGAGSVIGVDVETGQEVWRGEVEGNAFSLSAANGRLYVSTDRGTIHCFAAP